MSQGKKPGLILSKGVIVFVDENPGGAYGRPKQVLDIATGMEIDPSCIPSVEYVTEKKLIDHEDGTLTTSENTTTVRMDVQIVSDLSAIVITTLDGRTVRFRNGTAS